MVKKKDGARKKDTDESRVFAWLATFFLIVGFIIALIVKRDDKYVMYYAKQGLVLFFGFVIGSTIQFIPIVGQLFMAFMIVLWVMAWINAISGQKRKTWIVQDIADKIKI